MTPILSPNMLTAPPTIIDQGHPSRLQNLINLLRLSSRLTTLLMPALISMKAWGVYSPEDTIFEATQGRLVEPGIVQKDGVLPVEYTDSNLTGKDLPPMLKRMRTLLNINARLNDDAVFNSFALDVLGPYDPIRAKIFYVPYIPIPVSEFDELLKGINLSQDLKKFLFFQHNGVEFVRYFIHPSRTSSYNELIEKYGIVRGEIPGFLAGSPRSFVVWDPSDPSLQPFVVKTSLHFKVNDDIKLNIPQKTHRSAYVNSAFAAIDPATKSKYGFDFLPESLQILPKNKITATFYREFLPEYFQQDRVMVSGYFLSSPRAMGRPPAILEIIEGKSNPVQAAAEVLRPMLRAFAYLSIEEGLNGELHEQNVDFEVQLIEKEPGQRKPRNMFEYSSTHWGRLTGRVVVKDLDSFRVDTEMRVLKKKSIAGLRESFKPFIYSKFSLAAGWGGREAFPQTAYDSYIRDTFGYSFTQVLRKGLGLTGQVRAELKREFANVFAQEMSVITGENIRPPHQTKTSSATWVNEAVANEKAKLYEKSRYQHIDKALLNQDLQNMLREEFLRLRALRRASSVLGSIDADGVFFLLHRDVIEVRHFDRATGEESMIALAELESDRKVGQMQFEIRLKRLLRPGVIDAVQAFRQRESATPAQGGVCSTLF